MFTACGVITITTDFGHQGPFVATMKGRILARLPARANHRRHARGAGLLAGRGGLLAGARVRLFSGRLGACRRGRSGRRAPRATSSPSSRMATRSSRRTTACWRLSWRERTRLRDLPARPRAGDGAVPAAAGQRDFPWSRHFRADRGRNRGRARHTGGAGTEDHGHRAVLGRRARRSRADQVAGVVITIDHFGNLITNIDADLIRAFCAPSRPDRRPHLAAAAHLWRRPARRVSGPGQLLRRHRDRPGRAERRRGAGAGTGRPGDRLPSR